MRSKMTDWLINNKAINEHDRELYKYALDSMLFTVSPIILAIIIGIFTHSVRESIIMILPFVFIRSYSGGFHARHLSTCLILSIILLFLAVMLSKILQPNILLICLVILSVISLAINSPSENDNKNISEADKIIYRKKALKHTLIFTCIGFALCLCGLPSYAICVFIGIILAASMQVPNIILKYVRID